MYLVFDVGGTTLRGAVYDPDANRLVRTLRCSTPSHWSSPAATAPDLRALLFLEMSEMSQALLPGKSPSVICVAFPGPVDGAGRVLTTPTVWRTGAAASFVAATEFARLWPSGEIHVINDVTAAGYRYVADGIDDFCIVTVSSGIGHKVFIGGREIIGRGGRGGEIGHWVMDWEPDAPLCDCGGRGHLGALASGRGALLIARRRAKLEPLLFEQSRLSTGRGGDAVVFDTEDLVAAFLGGDPWAVRLIADVARPLGRALGAIHLTVGVEQFVLVGGFGLALGEAYRRLVANSASESCLDLGQDWDAMVQLGHADDDSGLIGSGLYVARIRCAGRWAPRSLG